MQMSMVYNIFWDDVNKWISMDWDGYSTSAQFIEGTELMYTLIRKHNASKILANIKNMTLIGREDQDYTVHSFLPRAIESGFRAIAIVKPLNYFNAVAIETIGYRIKDTVVQMRVFRNREEASEWLRSLDI